MLLNLLEQRCVAVPQWVLFRVSSPFLLLFRRRKEAPLSPYPSTPQPQRCHGKGWLQRASCAPAPSQSYKSRLCCELRPGRRSENPSGFMTANATRRQRRIVSTCAGAPTLGLLPQREPVCVIFVRSPNARLQLPWQRRENRPAHLWVWVRCGFNLEPAPHTFITWVNKHQIITFPKFFHFPTRLPLARFPK